MFRLAFLVLATLAATAAPAAPEWNPVATPARAEPDTDRLIVRLRARAAARPAAALEALGARAGVLIAHSHSITTDVHVARLFRAQRAEELDDTLARLRADGAVAYAEPDRRKHAHAVTPNDPLFTGTPGLVGQTGQWYLQAPQVTPSGPTTSALNATGAWATTTGTSGIVIADLDTGVRFDHPDLLEAGGGGKLLPGFDFVGCDGGGGANCGAGSTYNAANDGDGWDPDPSDPGDWISASDLRLPEFSNGCSEGPSSWHGTRTAGILGALTNNALGIAGTTWNSWLVPVRVLGKCGGYDSDIIAAMLWAAGLAVQGAPPNPFPARILNMSLGSPNSCAASYIDAIARITAAGAVVVASAGNEGGPVDEPANCPGAIGVVGVRHAGSKVGYSSLGTAASLAAPAGNCINTSPGTPCLFAIDTTTNSGTTTPGTNGYTDQLNPNIGTSFSAPLVSGIAALMLSVNGNLSPAMLLARLKGAANQFPTVNDPTSGTPVPQCQVPVSFSDTSQAIECNCTRSTCGAGLADAAKSVAAALRPIAAIAAPAATAPGQTVTLDASGSAAACGSSVASFAWSITSGSGAALTSPNTATTSLTAPSTGTITVQLVVTDSAGLSDTATIVVGASATQTSAPASAGVAACPAAIAAPAPTVRIALSPLSITLGQSATLTWSVAGAMSCSASGAWNGGEATTGTQPVTPTATGALAYKLDCSGTGGKASASATLNVAAASPPGGHGGGGSLDAPALVMLAGLAALRRRRRRPPPDR